MKSDQCIEQLHPELVAQSQYNAGNSRFVEHEYSYIAELQPPNSTSGPDVGPRVEEMGPLDGEFDGSGQGVIGSGQPRLCRPMVDCGAQQCRPAPTQRSAMQLVDQPLQHLTPAFNSIVSLADDDTIAIRGVAPLSRCSSVAPPPAARQNFVPQVYTRHSSFPGCRDTLGNAAGSQ